MRLTAHSAPQTPAEIDRQEQELTRQQDLRAAALASMLDPFALLEPVIDATGRIADFRYLEANPAAATYLGQAPNAVVGLLLTEILAPATAEPLVSAYARVVRTGEPLGP